MRLRGRFSGPGRVPHGVPASAAVRDARVGAGLERAVRGVHDEPLEVLAARRLGEGDGDARARRERAGGVRQGVPAVARGGRGAVAALRVAAPRSAGMGDDDRGCQEERQEQSEERVSDHGRDARSRSRETTRRRTRTASNRRRCRRGRRQHVARRFGRRAVRRARTRVCRDTSRDVRRDVSCVSKSAARVEDPPLANELMVVRAFRPRNPSVKSRVVDREIPSLRSSPSVDEISSGDW